jgi:polyphosphate kinase 2 (PPK2 family)
LEEFTKELATAQELLYATDTYALLVILQALDAAGKDGTIKHVMSGVNPQGCVVVNLALVDSFEARTATEAARAASGQPRARRRRRSTLAALSVPTSHPPP